MENSEKFQKLISVAKYCYKTFNHSFESCCLFMDMKIQSNQGLKMCFSSFCQ